MKYYEISPWDEKEFMTPRSYKDCKSYAKLLRERKEYFSSMYWYCNYLIRKIIK